MRDKCSKGIRDIGKEQCYGEGKFPDEIRKFSFSRALPIGKCET
jgi:hypothetical protein